VSGATSQQPSGPINVDTTINVTPAQGMNEEALANHVKLQFDTHMVKTVKAARAATLSRVATGQ